MRAKNNFGGINRRYPTTPPSIYWLPDQDSNLEPTD
jgi:hypothetical protein